MKRFLSAVVSLISVSLTALPSSSAAGEVSSVWQVKSGANTIYFAGAVPFLREQDQPLPPQFAQAYKSVARVVFEVDPKESKDEERSQGLIRMGMFTDGGSIRKSLTKQTYRQLGDFLASTGAPRSALDQFRPWFAAIMLSMTELIKQGARPDLGVGGVIEAWALEDGKPISGLEGVDVEIGLLEALPKGAHEHMLRSTLEDVRDAEIMEKEFGDYLAAWRAGDVEALKKIEGEQDTEWDQLMQKSLVRDRGDKWLGQFEKALAGEGGEGTLFVLGLSQLIGEGNVLERLAAKGFEVGQLELAAPDEKGDAPRPGEERPPLIEVVLPVDRPAVD